MLISKLQGLDFTAYVKFHIPLPLTNLHAHVGVVPLQVADSPVRVHVLEVPPMGRYPSEQE